MRWRHTLMQDEHVCEGLGVSQGVGGGAMNLSEDRDICDVIAVNFLLFVEVLVSP